MSLKKRILQSHIDAAKQLLIHENLGVQNVPEDDSDDVVWAQKHSWTDSIDQGLLFDSSDDEDSEHEVMESNQKNHEEQDNMVEKSLESNVNRVAASLDITCENTLRIAHVYSKRVLKPSPEPVRINPCHIVTKSLDTVLNFKFEICNPLPRVKLRMNHSRKQRQPPPPPTPANKNSLGRIFPQLSQSRPRPPPGSSRPGGRAHTKAFIFYLILQHLEFKDIISLEAVSCGTYEYIHNDTDFQRIWGELAFRMFGASHVRQKTELVHLINNHRHTSLLVYGQAPISQNIQESLRGSERFNTLVVCPEVPCNQQHSENISVAKALFCAAKASSPCCILVRDEDFLSGHVSRAGATKTSDSRATLKRKDIAELVSLIRTDCSENTVAVVCCSTRPWHIQDSLLGLFGQFIRIRNEASTVLEIDKALASIPHNLSKKQISQIHSIMEFIRARSPEFSFQEIIMPSATSCMMTRIRAAGYFRLEDNLYRACTEYDIGALEKQFLELEADMIYYGPYTVHDFLRPLNEEKIKLDSLNDLRFSKSIHTDSSMETAELRLNEWEAVSKFKRSKF